MSGAPPALLLAAAAPPFFGELAALLVAGSAVAYLSFRFGLVPIVGFLLAGVLIGPHALGLVRDPAVVEGAAEVGVILLLFTIGIEFKLERLARIAGLIFGGGTLQVGLATAAIAGLVLLAGGNWRDAVFTGFLVSLSSTAIVLKLLAARGEMATPHGQDAVGLLIFQDLAVVVMVLLVPMLAGSAGSPSAIGGALLTAVLIVALVLLVARRLMPPVLERIARTCSPELFLLSVIAICFGTAYLTSLAGVSLSLGAFLAGLVVSESRFSEHALGEITPLQILFSATFFVSVGMLLDLRYVVAHVPLVLLAIGAVLVVKLLTTGIAVGALRRPLAGAGAAALVLAQVGEFSFVLERAGRDAGLSVAGLAAGSQLFIATTVLLMVLTPVLAGAGARLAGRRPRRTAGVTTGSGGAADATAAASPGVAALRDHVIVAGFGARARRLTRLLADADVPFVVATLSPDGALEAEREGYPTLRGDYARPWALEEAGLDRASALVLPDDEAEMAGRVATVVRGLRPELPVVARARGDHDVARLREAGSTTVVAEEPEAVVRLYGELLERLGGTADARHDAEDAARPWVYAAGASRDGSADARDGAVPPRLPVAFDTQTAIDARGPSADGCTHVAGIVPVVPRTAGCEECLATGSTWVHLRLCLTCGHVGCCDSSEHRHASRHFHETAHPVMRSLEPAETWRWCYVDGREV